LKKNLPSSKKKILVTAGPTYEPIDSVRFIGNFSTGKMGYAIANEASNQGADVTLISGPTNGLKINDNISVKNIVTSDEMFNKCKDEFVKCEVLIMAAAVADIKPLKVYKSKMKKSLIKSTLEINSTVDILYELGKKKGSKIIIGFALESVNSVVNAEKKLKSKNLDGIVLNSLDNENSCFGSETNKITFLNKKGERNVYPTKDKKLVAKDILQHVKQMF
jgi:phosphopantothenoylcysteine decarboxylase/phosphopantothenate--cysteine ligase